MREKPVARATDNSKNKFATTNVDDATIPTERREKVAKTEKEMKREEWAWRGNNDMAWNEYKNCMNDDSCEFACRLN